MTMTMCSAMAARRLFRLMRMPPRLLSHLMMQLMSWPLVLPLMCMRMCALVTMGMHLGPRLVRRLRLRMLLRRRLSTVVMVARLAVTNDAAEAVGGNGTGAAGAGTGIDEPTAAAQARHDGVYGRRDDREYRLDGRGHRGILGVHERHDLEAAQRIERSRTWVVSFRIHVVRPVVRAGPA